MASSVWFSCSPLALLFRIADCLSGLWLQRGLAGGFLGEGQGADGHGFFSELRELQDERREHGFHEVLKKFAGHCMSQRFVKEEQASAEDDGLRVLKVNDVGKAGSEVGGGGI